MLLPMDHMFFARNHILSQQPFTLRDFMFIFYGVFIFPPFAFVKVSFLWAGGSVLLQHISRDIGYNQPFVFTYVASCAISMCLPTYLGMSLLGLVYNPPLRDKTGWCSGMGCGSEPLHDGSAEKYRIRTDTVRRCS